MDILDLVLSALAIALTAGLGYVYKTYGNKVDEAISLLEYIAEAGKDRKLEKHELQEIWRRINALRGKV